MVWAGVGAGGGSLVGLEEGFWVLVAVEIKLGSAVDRAGRLVKVRSWVGSAGMSVTVGASVGGAAVAKVGIGAVVGGAVEVEDPPNDPNTTLNTIHPANNPPQHKKINSMDKGP